MSLKERAKKLKTDIPAVFLALKAKETPWYAKLFAALTVVYALSPIDFVPDFIPVLGYLDDVILLPALVALTIKFIPKETFQKYREESEGMWADGEPKKWYYAIPIVVVWLLNCAADIEGHPVNRDIRSNQKEKFEVGGGRYVSC